MVIKKTDGSELLLPSKVTDYPVTAGEVISFQTGGGGGYGDPLERDAGQVRRDLKQGLISRQRATSDYQVAHIQGGKRRSCRPGAQQCLSRSARCRRKSVAALASTESVPGRSLQRAKWWRLTLENLALSCQTTHLPDSNHDRVESPLRSF